MPRAENLTPAEVWLYFRISEDHRQAGTLPLIGLDARVPPGPFLEDLLKHGLVVCTPEWVVTGGLMPVLGKPYQFCFGPK